jgi:hypothetical protein
MLFTPLYGTLLMAGATSARVSACTLANGNTKNISIVYYSFEIKSLGFGLGLSRKVYKIFLRLDYYNFAEFFDQSKDPSFEAGFNTQNTV